MQASRMAEVSAARTEEEKILAKHSTTDPQSFLRTQPIAIDEFLTATPQLNLRDPGGGGDQTETIVCCCLKPGS